MKSIEFIQNSSYDSYTLAFKVKAVRASHKQAVVSSKITPSNNINRKGRP